jgi:plasmid stabilization system protein ParE
VTRSLAFTSRAADDVEEAYKWYESQEVGLGAEFESSLAAVLRLVREMPEAGPIVHRGVRRLLLERFPYSLYYRLTDSTIEVRACLHQRRNPKTQLRRA